MTSSEGISISFSPYSLLFKEPGGTSRGVLTKKQTYFVRVSPLGNPSASAYGEVPFFPGLSAETADEVEDRLEKLGSAREITDIDFTSLPSSLIFGLEQALDELTPGNPYLKPDSDFISGNKTLTINGLVWMGSLHAMLKRATEKLNNGFHCIKIKIGAINWEDEISLIRSIRDIAGNDITIRVDANGAFSQDDCLWRLEELAQFGIHSVEQPVRAGNWKLMRRVCENSPVPVALDEELIGLPPSTIRDEMLDFIRPQFLILKPALCYGFSGARDWIRRAEKASVGWWITSALESSVGLSAIASFTSGFRPEMPQGLGTGSLFTNNFDSTLSLEGERLRFIGPAGIYNCQLEKLHWRHG